MCRNARIPHKKSLAAYLGDLIHHIPDYQPCDNANSFDHPEIPIMPAYGEVDLAIWGLVPEWVKEGDFDKAKAMMDSNRNAVSETVFERASYKHSIRQRRCIMFIEAIHEWQHVGKKKVPYIVSMQKEGELIPAAGIWTNWYDTRAGQLVKTCSMLTTAANPLMSEIHNSKQRQPLILDRSDWEGWLTKGLPDAEIQSYFRVFPDGGMKAEKVEVPEKESKAKATAQRDDTPDLFGNAELW